MDEGDVVHALNFAREQGLLVAVRGGGHNVAGFGGIVIDLSSMNRVVVDPAMQTAIAQGEVTWGAFDEATQAWTGDDRRLREHNRHRRVNPRRGHWLAGTQVRADR
jgi:hypothetical protein